MPLTEDKLKEFENRLKELAAKHPERLLNLPGVNYKTLMVCMERETGKSMGQITIRLGLPYDTVRYICRQCDGKPNKRRGRQKPK